MKTRLHHVWPRLRPGWPATSPRSEVWVTSHQHLFCLLLALMQLEAAEVRDHRPACDSVGNMAMNLSGYAYSVATGIAYLVATIKFIMCCHAPSYAACVRIFLFSRLRVLYTSGGVLFDTPSPPCHSPGSERWLTWLLSGSDTSEVTKYRELNRTRLEGEMM